ncbi:hypothetical protein [Novosphingobium sp. KACC 22771]|uniref:hypothetical protein n=1 Tax=Novosphingobium sp. KACC 22771 TaxID=3025670 RepID=UPI0023674054|nr:hypothetical protein [Novosphingobium sp. KACC 22771]WDF72074.1 hypothetical protein PQ467_14945 [Novosphingobium sp. KACC 22771]
MKNLLAWAFAVSLLSGAPVQAAGPGLDFHLFENAYVRNGAPEAGYEAVRRAVPVGADARGGVALLRQAGAHCGAERDGQVDCFYRERISVDDVVDTYATWDVQLDLNAGKVAEVAVARSVEQR